MAQYPLLVSIFRYRINPPSIVHVQNAYIWTNPQAMPFEMISGSNIIHQSVIEGSAKINFRVELDDPLNFISSSGSIEIDEPTEPTALSVLDLNDLDNLLVVQIYNGDTLAKEFLGIVDPSNSYFDEINRTYHLSFYDAFTYIYNHISDYLAKTTVDGQPIGDMFPYYQELSTGDQYIPLDFFLKTYNSFGGDVSTDLDLSFIVDRARVLSTQLGAISINDFMDSIRNYYGAYAFIDGGGTLRFISRNRGQVNAGIFDITDDIEENDYLTNYVLPPEHNAILCSSILPDEEGTLYLNHLIYYDDGVQYKIIKGDTDISSFNYLDLRVSLPGGISGLYVLPSRTIDELKVIYGDMVTPNTIVKCQVNRLDLNILNRVTINEDQYIIMDMEKDYDQQTSTLELLKKQ